ncbi:hypothetical protein [Aestuariimicrobium ganziense]|uniref:hypothetical protein n=1 Tax=Aestuariimicrobium ganziense TaxID=2773677 RepID=UPI0019408EC0|nr:hypothetical protein [Aestuariimicrobium ganziense]
MGELRMHALSIIEIRDMFGASTELAGTLRQLAGERFRVAAPQHRQRGLLGKLGPFLKRSAADSPVFPDGMPLPSDWENLIAGRYIAPDRVDVSWQVIDTWVDALDWGTWTAPVAPSGLDDLDFALARAGMPSRYGLRKLMADDPQLTIRPGTGMRVGYSKNQHVLATLASLEQVVDEVDESHRPIAQGLRDFLADIPRWTAEATELNRPAPDLFVVWRDDIRG